MRYNIVKNASSILESNSYLIKNPFAYKGKWSSVFKNNNPICLELGMGRGTFIIEMAKTHPNINYIGLELDKNQTATALKNIKDLQLNNLKIINADALKVAEIFGREIDTIYLTFPEPWPKAHDEKRRLTHVNYLKLYDRVFKKTKHIILKTDNKGYFAYSLMSLSQYWYTFNRVSLDLHHEEKPIPNVLTNYEKQYQKEGRPIYYLDATFEN